MTARPLLTDDVTPGEAIARVLEEAGIDAVFGMPGGYTFALFDALVDHRDSIRTVLVREESRAGVMAEVYGRLTGRPGVCIGQGAFMVHASLGALEARLSSSPMLILADLSDNAPYSLHGPYQSGTGAYGSWDARAVFSGMCKEVFVAHTPAEAVQSVQLAVKASLAGQQGPVAVLFHSGSLRGKVGPSTRPALWSTGPYLAATATPPATAGPALARAGEVLAGAARPVVVAGGGVRLAGAYDELRRAAESLGAPVATTASGKGVFPETHPLALGVMGNFGTPAANAVLADADVVLVVGSKLAPTDTALENPALLDPSRQRIVQVDVDERNAAWTYPVDVAVVADARAALAWFADTADRDGTLEQRRRATAERMAAARAAHGHFDAPELSSGASPLLPQRAIAELARAVPDDAIVCCDAGENRIFMTHYFQTKGPATFVQPAGVGAMGYAVPSALAAKVVHPGRVCVAVCGDGGMGIAMNGLLTAREEGLAVVVVVLNNSALGWVFHGQRDRPIASRFVDVDHAAVARAMGVDGVRVHDAAGLSGALRDAIASGRTTLIDVVTSLDETFEKVTSPLTRW